MVSFLFGKMIDPSLLVRGLKQIPIRVSIPKAIVLLVQ